MKNTKSFTLVELIIVAVIVGLLGFVAIPNMLKTVKRAYAKETLQNLMAIYAVQQDYVQNHGSYWTNGTSTCNLNCINSGLGLNLVANDGITYNLPNVVPNVVYARRSVTSETLYMTFTNPINSLNPVYCDPADSTVPLRYNPCCYDTNPATVAGQTCNF